MTDRQRIDLSIYQRVDQPPATLPARFILVVLAGAHFHFMLQLITILNRCHRFPGFIYHRARFSSDHKSIEIAVRPRKGSTSICSRCHQPAPGYDQLAERRFEFKRTLTRAYMLFLARCLELALYHSLGKLPEPESTHNFF